MAASSLRHLRPSLTSSLVLFRNFTSYSKPSSVFRQTLTPSIFGSKTLRSSSCALIQCLPFGKYSVRCKTSGSGYSPLNDSSQNWGNRPPKETILLDGCDYEHWLIVMEFPKDPRPPEDDMVNTYIKTLAAVVGSEEEAKKKIYSVSTHTYTGFGALISEELSYKVKALPGVLWVLPDSYIDVPKKDYGGDLFIDGKVIARPEYRYPERSSGRNDRPRPRYDRRRDNMQVERRQTTPMQQTPMQRRDPMPMERRDPMAVERRDQMPMERRDTAQGSSEGLVQTELRDPVHTEGSR